MHFFYKPNACFGFGWIDECIQWNVFIASSNPQTIPLLYGEIGQVVHSCPYNPLIDAANPIHELQGIREVFLVGIGIICWYSWYILAFLSITFAL